ncbi:hypothetical protein ACC690_39205, partial [Rhizobium johnstonii]
PDADPTAQHGKRLLTSIEATYPRFAQPQQMTLRLICSAFVAFGVFLSGFVIDEPVRYSFALSSGFLLS